MNPSSYKASFRNGSPIKLAMAQKISHLFSERLIKENMIIDHVKPALRRPLMTKLRHLQRSIYILDKYGEDNWELNKDALNRIWAGIHLAVKRIVANDTLVQEMLQGIKDYQAVEAGSRYDSCPTRLDLRDFYFLKTCDVRMMRRLIRVAGTDEREDSSARLWELYDLASEVYDDLCDITEDKTTFNCNRFLLERQKQGDFVTQNKYSDLLDTIKSDTIRLKYEFMSQSSFSRSLNFVHTKTIARIEEAVVLLFNICRIPAASVALKKRKDRCEPLAF